MNKYKLVVKVLIRIYIIFLSLSDIRNIHLGSKVRYKGMKYLAFDGTRLDAWELSALDEVSGYVIAPTNEIRLVRSISNYWHNYIWMYRFIIENWSSIWERELLEMPNRFGYYERKK